LSKIRKKYSFEEFVSDPKKPVPSQRIYCKVLPKKIHD
jgi:hypothetical protein